MAKVYCVSYDLKKPGQDYVDLIKELKKTPGWWHCLESTWLLHTSETPDQIFARLFQWMDKNDRILIIEVTNNYEGWLTEDAWNWIRNSVGKINSFAA